MACPIRKNLDTALMLEETVRSAGATPATIAVIEGRFKVGLDRKSLEQLARLSGGVVKASRRDLAAVAARHGSAGTTVAATMYIAELAGIEIFATGGIGGVHRGAEETFDISADLVELARTKVAVVCAGAKSILDIDKTLEYLESQGVAVCGYQCDEFPAFYARTSGVRLDHRCDGAQDLARMIRLQRQIGPGGLLIANPIPEDHALDAAGDREAHRRGGRGSQGEGHREERGHALSARAHRRTHRRAQPRGEHGAGQEQRPARRAGRRGTGPALSQTSRRILVIGDVMTDYVVLAGRPDRAGFRPAGADIRARRRFGGDAGGLARAPGREGRFRRPGRRGRSCRRIVSG